MNQIARDSRGLHYQLNEIANGLVQLAQIYGRSSEYDIDDLTYIGGLTSAYRPLAVFNCLKDTPEYEMLNRLERPMELMDLAQKLHEVNKIKRITHARPETAYRKTKQLWSQLKHYGFLTIPKIPREALDLSRKSFPPLGSEPAPKKQLRSFKVKPKTRIQVTYPNALSSNFQLNIGALCVDALKRIEDYKDNQMKERLQLDNKEVWPAPAEAFRLGMRHHGRRHTKPSFCG